MIIRTKTTDTSGRTMWRGRAGRLYIAVGWEWGDDPAYPLVLVRALPTTPSRRGGSIWLQRLGLGLFIAPGVARNG